MRNLSSVDDALDIVTLERTIEEIKKNGTGIKDTAITYAGSTSGTTPPKTGWETQVTDVPQGQYLWTRVVWQYADSTSKTSYSVAHIGKDGVGIPQKLTKSGDTITLSDGGGSVVVKDTTYKSGSGLKLSGTTFSVDTDTHPTKDEVEQAIQNVDVSGQLASKADVDHTHVIDDVNGLQSSLDGKADVYHTHAEYFTRDEVDFSDYLTAEQTSAYFEHFVELFQVDILNLFSRLDSKAHITHSHPISDITGLQSALSDKANANHSHSEYALKSEMPKIEQVTQSQYDSLLNKGSNTLYVVVG